MVSHAGGARALSMQQFLVGLKMGHARLFGVEALLDSSPRACAVSCGKLDAQTARCKSVPRRPSPHACTALGEQAVKAAGNAETPGSRGRSSQPVYPSYHKRHGLSLTIHIGASWLAGETPVYQMPPRKPNCKHVARSVM